MIRVRHYTRISSKDKILEDMVIIARDQNCVFVELANRKPHAARKVEGRYKLVYGKGNAFIEFDAREDEVFHQTNPLNGEREYFLIGNVDLRHRNPRGSLNR